MQLPRGVRFSGWTKWKLAWPFLAIAAGAAFYVVVIVVAVPRDVTAMWVIAGYTFLGGVACLVVVAALFLARQLPTAREATWDRKPASGCWRGRSWR